MLDKSKKYIHKPYQNMTDEEIVKKTYCNIKDIKIFKNIKQTIYFDKKTEEWIFGNVATSTDIEELLNIFNIKEKNLSIKK